MRLLGDLILYSPTKQDLRRRQKPYRAYDFVSEMSWHLTKEAAQTWVIKTRKSGNTSLGMALMTEFQLQLTWKISWELTTTSSPADGTRSHNIIMLAVMTVSHKKYRFFKLCFWGGAQVKNDIWTPTWTMLCNEHLQGWPSWFLCFPLSDPTQTVVLTMSDLGTKGLETQGTNRITYIVKISTCG